MARQSQRGPAQILIRSLIPLYLKPTAIVNILIKEGLGYHNQTMFQDTNKVLQNWFTAERAAGADPFQNMPEAFMTKTPFKNIREYRAFGWGITEDIYTGDQSRTRISFYFDGPSDNPTLEAQALEDFGKTLYSENQVLVGFERDDVWKNADTFDWAKVRALKPL